MKRYDIHFQEIGTCDCGWGEKPNGRYVKHSEVQSHARALLAVVERMEHFTLCDTWNPGINDGCTCPLGELRRGLEVML